MVREEWEIVWTQRAQRHLRQIFDYISADSPKNASKVINDIIDAANKSVSNPEIYARDKYRRDNDGSYLAFEKNHYRISYKAEKNVIRILWVRHTGRKPKFY